MSGIVRTQVFASDAETQEISELAEVARSTPVIAMSSAHGLESGGFAGDAWQRVNETIYAYALVRGLHAIEGFYGLDPSNGEFLAPEGDTDE